MRLPEYVGSRESPSIDFLSAAEAAKNGDLKAVQARAPVGNCWYIVRSVQVSRVYRARVKISVRLLPTQKI